MPRPQGQELADLGKEYRWKPGQSGNPRGRPVLDQVERALREAEREARLTAQWLADLESDDPTVRLPVRRDLIDRLAGKAPQSVNLTIEEPEEVEWERDSP